MIARIREALTKLPITHPKSFWTAWLFVWGLIIILFIRTIVGMIDTKTNQQQAEMHIIHIHPDVENSLDYDPYSSLEFE